MRLRSCRGKVLVFILFSVEFMVGGWGRLGLGTEPLFSSNCVWRRALTTTASFRFHLPSFNTRRSPPGRIDSGQDVNDLVHGENQGQPENHDREVPVVRVVSEVVYERHLKSSSMTANKLTRTYKAP
jgi:hypothetical protein